MDSESGLIVRLLLRQRDHPRCRVREHSWHERHPIGLRHVLQYLVKTSRCVQGERLMIGFEVHHFVFQFCFIKWWILQLLCYLIPRCKDALLGKYASWAVKKVLFHVHLSTLWYLCLFNKYPLYMCLLNRHNLNMFVYFSRTEKLCLLSTVWGDLRGRPEEHGMRGGHTGHHPRGSPG